MDIKEFELIQKQLEEADRDIMEIEAMVKVVTGNIKEKLNKYKTKDPKELIKLRDSLELECQEEFKKAKEHLAEIQPKIADIKNTIVL